MEGRARSTGQAHGELTDDATRALRSLAASALEPILLGYYPVARLNPFLDLLYGACWDHAIAPLPIVRRERIPELGALVGQGFRGVLHLHWLNQILADARSVADARASAAAFLAELDRFRGLGGRVAWTVHNVLPHGARFEDEEAQLSQGVVDRADVVHVMAASTPAEVGRWFRIPPAKLLQIEHPSYLGAYPDAMTRPQARHLLGLLPGDLVFAVVGTVRPYKGLDDLLDAWDRLDDGVPRQLVIAGEPSEEPGVEALIERAVLTPGVTIHARTIDPGELQMFLRAADVAVLPYVRTLNSGALLLALTFGVPVIVPDGPLAGATEPAFARTFAPGDRAALAEALAGASSLATSQARTAARAAAQDRAPDPIAERFASELRARLDGLAAG